MNEFIMLNWYHFDLNYKIINILKNNKKSTSKKYIIYDRIQNDFQLKIKKD